MNPPATRPVLCIEDYNPDWPRWFCEIQDRVWPAVQSIAAAIEHVGSTAVPTLAAKPVIDVDLVVASRDRVALVIKQLKLIGYEHRGNLGIEDREAFRTSVDLPPHHLYVCLEGSVALRNHLALRDHLRSSPSDVARYSVLKKQLAERYAHDIDLYVQGKTELILSLLAKRGFSAESLTSIRRANER